MHRLYNLFKIAQLASGRARIPKPGLIDSRGCVLHLCDKPYVYKASPLIQNVYFRMHFFSIIKVTQTFQVKVAG